MKASSGAFCSVAETKRDTAVSPSKKKKKNNLIFVGSFI